MKTLQLEDDELHRQFKITAAQRGMPLKRATEEAVENWVEKFMSSLDAVRERNRRTDEAVAEMSGISVAELDADTTAPDPRPEEAE